MRHALRQRAAVDNFIILSALRLDLIFHKSSRSTFLLQDVEYRIAALPG